MTDAYGTSVDGEIGHRALRDSLPTSARRNPLAVSANHDCALDPSSDDTVARDFLSLLTTIARQLQRIVDHVERLPTDRVAARPAPDLMTAAEIIEYLGLAIGGGNPAERLRNLIRRQSLPVIRRGGLQLFRRSIVDSWLDAGQRNRRRAKSQARLEATPKVQQ
jgi:hypothetical protein